MTLTSISDQYVLSLDGTICQRDFKDKYLTLWFLLYLFVGGFDIPERQETENEALLCNQNTVNHLPPPFIDLLVKLGVKYEFGLCELLNTPSLTKRSTVHFLLYRVQITNPV